MLRLWWLLVAALAIPVRNAAERARLRPRSLATWEAVNEAIALARRDKLSPQEAARQVGVSMASWRRYAPESLIRDRRGRQAVSKADRRYVGEMRITSTSGVVERAVRGSRQRTRLARHANAVRRYLETGDPEPLDEFRGVRIAGVELETDPDRLDEYARQGEFEWFDLYE